MNTSIEKFLMGQLPNYEFVLSRPFVVEVGPNAAVMLALLLLRFGALYYAQESGGFSMMDGKDMWFEVKSDWVKSQTGISFPQQTIALQTLEKHRMIDFLKQPGPNKRYVRISDEFMEALVDNEKEGDSAFPEKSGYLHLASSP